MDSLIYSLEDRMARRRNSSKIGIVGSFGSAFENIRWLLRSIACQLHGS
jgi:hypothetical protein